MEDITLNDLATAEGADWLTTRRHRRRWPSLQYTSGSTAVPKGVVVSHGNLIANEHLIRVGFDLRPDDVMVSWLPLYHDMGLIGGMLQPIYAGILASSCRPSISSDDRHAGWRPSTAFGGR